MSHPERVDGLFKVLQSVVNLDSAFLRDFLQLSFLIIYEFKRINNFKKKLYAPFLLMGFSCQKATEPQQGGSLLFTT